MVPEVQRKMANRAVVISLVWTVAGMTLCNLFYFLSLTRISAPLTSLFKNTVPIILLGVRFVSGQPVAALESWGVMIAMVGAGLVGYEALSAGSDSSNQDFVIGTLYGCLAAVFAAVYLIYGKICRPDVDVFVLNFVVCVVSSLASIVTMALYFPGDLGPYDSLPVKSQIGTLFGFMTSWSLFVPQLCISVMIDFFSITGFLALMKYFDSLFLSIACLTSPIITMLIDVIFSITGIPDSLTIGGCIVVIVGCGFVVKASAGEKTQVIEASKMLQARREGKTSLGIFSRTTETSRSSTRTRSTSHGSIEMKMKQTKGRDFKSPLVPVKDDEWERSEGGVSRDRSVQHNRYGAV